MTSNSEISAERRAAWREYKARVQAERESRAPKPRFVFTRDHAASGHGGGGGQAHLQPGDSADTSEPEPHPLFVYEPADLNDFSAQEVRLVWDQRLALCGTLEAAAEAFAILRVASGADESYRGWQAYMQHALVRELAEHLPGLPDVHLPHGAPVSSTDGGLDADSRGHNDVNDASLDYWLIDAREVAARNVRLRRGQSRFREEVLDFHEGKCCVTGCADEVLLEAAHISPYKGDHTHDVRNGLCLRVDIHRLFDRFLLSIDDRAMVVRVSPIITDAAYRTLDGRRIFRAFNAPHRELLRAHFAQFMRRPPA